MKFTAGATLLSVFLSTVITTVCAGASVDASIRPSKTSLDKFCVLQAKDQGIPSAAAEKYIWSSGKCVDSDDNLEERCKPLIKEKVQEYLAATKGSAFPNYKASAPQLLANSNKNPSTNTYPGDIQLSIFCPEGEAQCFRNCNNLCGRGDDGCGAAKAGCWLNCEIFC